MSNVINLRLFYEDAKIQHDHKELIEEHHNTVAVDVKTGVLKWFNFNRKFGFIQQDDGSPDAFVHWSQMKILYLNYCPKLRQPVEYTMAVCPDGRFEAKNVTGRNGVNLMVGERNQ